MNEQPPKPPPHVPAVTRSGAALALVVVAAALLASCGGPEAGRESIACSEPFDSADWQDLDTGEIRRNQLARQIVRCNLLKRASPGEVRQMLGSTGLVRKHPGDEGAGPWFMAYDVAWVGDYVGPGDAQTLYVYFDRRKRVVSAELAPEGTPADDHPGD